MATGLGPFANRRFAVSVVPGIQTTLYGTDSVVSQIQEGPQRNVMALLDQGRFSSDVTQLAAGSTFAVPLPSTYNPSNRLLVLLFSDQIVKLTAVQPVLGTAVLMLRAGLAPDQPGIASFCGQVTSLSLLNSSATLANLEWFLLELPAIATNAGWRNGVLSTGLVAP